jgi:FKBP-type peptidyl-prolyl cis-trans isomerase (trigger factor)
MKQFGVDEKSLRRDIKNELTIKALLDQVFKEKGVAVSEDEIKAFYDKAGGVKAGLPKLAEVRDKIETQIRSTKEQEVVTGYIEELRKSAAIEVLI